MPIRRRLPTIHIDASNSTDPGRTASIVRQTVDLSVQEMANRIKRDPQFRRDGRPLMMTLDQIAAALASLRETNEAMVQVDFAVFGPGGLALQLRSWLQV